MRIEYMPIVLLLLVICLPMSGTAQKTEFEHITTENGLSQNSVFFITQDSKGFMWFGTRYGLNRYDGHHFKIYESIPGDGSSIQGDYISALLPAAAGRLWVGSNRGVDEYDPVKDAFRHVPLDNRLFPKGSSFFVNCLAGDRNGNVWIGTVNGLIELPAGRPEAARPLWLPGGKTTPGNLIHAIYEDHLGYLWVGTAGGLTRLAFRNGGYTAVTYRPDSMAGSLSDESVTSITEDSSYRLWIGTQNGGLDLYNRATGTFTVLSRSGAHPSPGLLSNYIRRIIPDKEGKLWIGTLEGVNIYDPVTGVFRSCQHNGADKTSLSQNSVYSLFRDGNGSIWVGTYFGGINVSYASTTLFTLYQNDPTSSSLDNNVVSGITEDEHHNLWIGTEGGGLNYFDRDKGRFTSYKNIPGDPHSLGSNLVKSLYRDKSGDIWVGTHGGGLNLLDPVHRKFTRYFYTPGESLTFNYEIDALLEDSKGILWAGYQNTLKFFQRTAKGWQPFRGPEAFPPFGIIRSLVEDRRKNIWIGTSAGLYLFDPGKGQCKQINDQDINCIREDSHGRIWVGVYFNGLEVYDPGTGKWINYTQADGLPNDNIVGILEDDGGNLWLSTSNGLSRFDERKGTFRNYTHSDGLAAGDFNYNSIYKSSWGALFFGGYNGITSFYPAQIGINTQTDPIVLTSLMLFNENVSVNGKDGLLKEDILFTREITFHYKQNVFTIGFALLNYIKSDKNTYAYRLEGFDKDWHYTASPSANYMNLPAGNYTFIVKGANNDGIWSAPVTLKISVLPPWWRTWWAYLIYILFVGSIIFLITRFFVLRALLRKDQALNQAKLNFFTNISHEIRTRLTLISGPIESVLLVEKGDSPLRRQLRPVKSNTDRLMKLVEELMDFRKAESRHLKLHVSRQNLIPFVRDIYTSFEDLARSRQINTDFISSREEVPLSFDPVQMEKVFYNLFTNAFKFTPDGGYISVTVERQKGGAEIRVTDNGKGIAPKDIPRLFDNYFQVDDQHTQNTGYGIGLALSKSIVQLHKGKLTVTSELGTEGASNRTCFTVSLPDGDRQAPDGSGHLGKDRVTADAEGGGLRGTSAPSGEVLPRGIAAGGARSGSGDTRVLPSPVAREKATLLLVEDNAEVRAFIVQSLVGAYRILEAPDGLSGWDRATEDIPDLVVSDVMMPGMDGIMLCGKLKADERTGHIPVILLTARAGMENQVSGLETGADIYLTKPFSIQILELHIRNLLATAAAMRQKFSHQLILQSPGPGTNALQDEFLLKLVGIIEDNMDDSEFDVPMLCTKIAMSQYVLYKKIKAMTDMSVGDFIKQVRLKKAAQLLEQKNLTVSEIAYTVGFSDSKYFSKEFKKRFGQTPRDYGKQGEEWRS
jgi:signal transduction histidine kinase/ligand-binding sensor domain-containing protein/AraC-like DNA-binding protein